MAKELTTMIEELQDLLGMVSDNFYTCLAYNQDKAIRGLKKEGMSDDQVKLVTTSVRAGVRATLATIDELEGEVRFKTRGVTGIISGNLVAGMFDDINT